MNRFHLIACILFGLHALVAAANEPFEFDINRELKVIQQNFPHEFEVMPCPPGRNAIACFDVIIITEEELIKKEQGGSFYKQKAKEKWHKTMKTRSKATNEIKFRFVVPAGYPQRAMPNFAGIEKNGCTKKELKRLENEMRTKARKLLQTGKPSIMPILRRAMEFVEDPDDPLRLRRIYVDVIILGIVILYIASQMLHCWCRRPVIYTA